MNSPSVRDVASLSARTWLPLLALLIVSATGFAQPAVPPLALKPITVGELTTPVSIAAPSDGSDRLFVCEQTGQIRVIQHGGLLPTPFVDLTSRLVPLSPNYDERGLLGLAFHPGFGNQASPGHGRFYVFYSAPSPNAVGNSSISAITAGNPCTVTTVTPHGLKNGDVVAITDVTGGSFSPPINFASPSNATYAVSVVDANSFTLPVNCSDTSGMSVSAARVRPTQPLNCRSTISEFQVSANDPNIADANSERVLLAFDKPQSNHNGGELQFGPDGFLYISVGDGGSQHDNDFGHTGGYFGASGNLGNAQDVTKVLGKILRIDPQGTNGPGGQYGIPPTNPFAGAVNGAREEIFAFGFRNPWRFSFDEGPGGTLRMYEADVGQDQVEEINLVTLGGNLGWRLKEGAFDHDNTAPNGGLPLIDPIAQYAHAATNIGNPPLPKIGCSVTGGYVYRGKAIPELAGKYVFADWSPSISTPGGTLLYIDENLKNADGTWTIAFPALVGGNPVTTRINAFGRDEAGELYIATRVARGPANDPINGPTGAIYKLIPAAVNSVTLTPTQDNSIYSESSSTSNAKGNLFSGRNANGDLRRALLAFDLSGQFGPGTTITGAQLTLKLNQTSAVTPANMSLYRLAQAWGEGTSGPAAGLGAPATSGDATWADRFYDAANPTLWTTAGGTFNASASATTSVGTALTTYAWSSAQLAADVQGWINNSATNFGWILVGDEASQSTRRFESRESAAAVQPSLQLTAASLPTYLDTTFDAHMQGGVVTASSVQADGKILVAGSFTAVNGSPANNLVRLNADGTSDSNFTASVAGTVTTVAVEDNGRILVGGVAPPYLVRLLADGSVDASFSSPISEQVLALAVQPDSKIAVATTGPKLLRLNADGTIDSSFSCTVDSFVAALASYPDGRLFIGGVFDQVNGVSRPRMARLNADGSLDGGFTPPTPIGSGGGDTSLFCANLQPDGKVIIGGNFVQLDTDARTALARLNADGSLDAGYAPAIGGSSPAIVNSMALEASGRLMIGGDFRTVDATTRNYVARINADGSLDYSFDPNADQTVTSVALQADGRILVGGHFGNVDGASRALLARLRNGTASSSLTVPSSSTILWQRAATIPETQQVTFELSIDGGATWSELGAGTRVSGGWELRGLNLPTSCQVRAHARTVGGQNDGSSGLTEAIAILSTAPSVVTGGATNIAPTSAALAGAVDANNAVASVAFEYGLSNTYGSTVSAAPPSASGDTATPVAITLTGLTARTTYHYRIKATNSVGTSVGNDATFTTANTPPVANSGTLNATSGRATLLDLLPLTSDAEGDTRTIFAGSAQHGSVSILPNGIVSYTPNASFSGTDTLTYLVSDGFGGTTTGTVTITVPARPVNPVADLLAVKDRIVPGAGVLGSGTAALPTGTTWLSFGIPAINDAGEVAFLATVKTPTGNTSGIFSGDPVAPTLIALAGEPAPGAPDTVFASFKDPVVDQGGAVAFEAKLANAPGKRGVSTSNNQGLWTNAYPGGLALIARTGSQATEAPTDAKWTSFHSFALADGIGGPLFVAKISGGGVKGGTDVGLWGYSSTGALRLLLREGDPVDVKTVRNFVVLSTVLYSPGQTRSFSRAGEIVLRAGFTDGSSGLVRLTLP